ncbi:MAG: hypothetical protein RBR42_02600 [Desulfomicrobium sp.]|jgi:hypothetical protein|nr:hypothetical protein [Desulfomicrobium sp.]NLV96843.1 hypothetical protein [Desulfovibrionales bacterium]
MHKILLACLAVFLLTTCVWAEVSIIDPHEHDNNVHTQPWEVEEGVDVAIMPIEVLPLEDDQLKDIVVNESQTMRAFIVLSEGPPEWQCEYVYFQNLHTDEIFVILGVPMPWRPFSDLVWVQDRYLVFDRWAQPHFGMHYVVDTKEKKLVLARTVESQ